MFESNIKNFICAVAYRRDRLDPVRVDNFNCRRLARLYADNDIEDYNMFEKQGMIQVVCFRDLFAEKLFIVTNSHPVANPKYEYAKMAQAHALMQLVT
jgi:hypothetical protein